MDTNGATCDEITDVRWRSIRSTVASSFSYSLSLSFLPQSMRVSRAEKRRDCWRAEPTILSARTHCPLTWRGKKIHTRINCIFILTRAEKLHEFALGWITRDESRPFYESIEGQNEGVEGCRWLISLTQWQSIERRLLSAVEHMGSTVKVDAVCW